ncbi:MAG TPA: hypothetical protein VGI19_17430 [Candidatus Cybelea sp.]
MRIDAVVSVSAGPHGGLNAVIRPADSNEIFSVDTALIIVSIWQEAAGIVRGSFRHPRSGTTALVQGNAALLDLGNQLRVKRRLMTAHKQER